MKVTIALATLLMMGALASAQVPGKTLQNTKKALQPMTTGAQASSPAKTAGSVDDALPKTGKKAKSPFGGKAAAQNGSAEKGGEAKPEMAAAKGGRRDPFLSPIRPGGRTQAPCTGGGKRCLEIGTLILRGIVKSEDGYIALVAVPAGSGTGVSERAYFLRQNDPVYNGYVLRITNNQVVFKENVVDKLGKTTQREVVKSISGGESKG